MLDSSFKSERHNKSDVSVSEETSRILKLRERVNTAQQKLQLLENTKRDARRIFSKLTDSDSPVRPSKDYSSNSILGLNPRQHFTEHEHDKSNRLSVTRQNIIDEPETDISQILPTNNKQRVLKEILVKMDLFRLNSPSTQKILDYFHEKIEGSKPYYYDFLRENNILVLKVLIQILYEEMEGISNDLEQSTTANSHQLDVLEKKLQDKTILCDRLTGELVQQNIELENLKKRMGPVTQDGNRVSIDHLFFVELKLLLQNILEEVFNSDADISQDQRMNFRYITKSLLDKLAKVDIESLKETYTEDPYRSQDLPRPAQDRTSLKYMFGGEKSALRGRGEQQGYESKFRRDAEEDNVRGELLSEINTLKGENRELRRQLDTKKKGGEQRNVSSNQDILMDELKRALNEKEKLEDEFQKLKQIYNISKEEINNLSNDIYKVTAEREKEQEILTHENRELKAAMATLEREVKNLEVRLRDDVGKMDAELNNAKERIGTMLEEKTVTERELFQLRVDKKELQAKLQSYEVHIDELVTERETVLANVTTFDDLVKNKNIELERLKRDNTQLEQAVHELREKEKILVEENEFIGNLKHEKVTLQKELKDAKEALKGSEEKLVAFQEEKKMFHNKLTTLEAFDTNHLTSASLEQLSKGIIAQSNIDVRLTEDERSKLQEIISSKFMQALIPIKHKLKKSESSVSEYKGKYRDKLLNLLERLEDSKWLTNIILQANDALARSDNEQIPGTLIVFKEELERKKEVIKGKLKEMIQQQESNQIELKKVFDEQENQAESFRDNFGLEIKYEDELEKVKDENEKMKAKLQTQSYEIAALNSQLKLASTVEETNKRVLNPQSTRDMRSSRVMKGTGTRDASRMSHSRYQDEEEEGSKSQEAMTSPKDLLLMLQSQASSIEILLGNGF